MLVLQLASVLTSVQLLVQVLVLQALAHAACAAPTAGCAAAKQTARLRLAFVLAGMASLHLCWRQILASSVLPILASSVLASSVLASSVLASSVLALVLALASSAQAMAADRALGAGVSFLPYHVYKVLALELA